MQQGKVRLPVGRGGRGHPEPPGTRSGGGGGEGRGVVVARSLESSIGDMSFGWKLSRETFIPTVQS